MHRNIIYIEKKNIIDNQVIIVGKDVNYLRNVLKKKIGDLIIGKTFIDFIYKLKIINIENNRIITKVVKKTKILKKNINNIVIALSIPKLETFKSIIKKCCELGVSEIIPIITERSFIKKKNKFNQERFEKIIIESLKQSGREDIMKLREITFLHDFLLVSNYTNYNKLFPYECEETDSIEKNILKLKHNNYLFIIGPEGGFSLDEADLIKDSGYLAVKLSDNILRVETAVLYSIIATKYKNYL